MPKQQLTAKQKLNKKRKRRKIVNTILGVIIFCTLLGLVSGVSTIALILSKSDVVLDAATLNSTESTLIYDDTGEQIAMLGKENRINVSYSELPQCVIDAFVAVEDSRFFEHPGFDIPRFAKAILENLSSLSFSQGGSTVTMQVIKNSYFAVDTIADRDKRDGVKRKVQEIYYSLKINNLVSKEKILELYINKVNYGSKARGIQVASEYYFGKDCTELNLVEAAMLAGVVNAPNRYNPYYHPIAAQTRTEDVLYYMNYHGYITDEEYETACKVKVINLLVGNHTSGYEDGKTIPYQSYIDTVISELEDEYGIDPYTTPVKVYTAMNKQVQEYCDSVSNGEVITFKDQYINTALAFVQNHSGLIVGLCGGRNYNRERMFNYATDSALQPGSTSKAVLTYPLGFEYANLATSYYFLDEPITWSGTSVRIRNDTNNYAGQCSIQRAFCSSYNIPAVKTLRMVMQSVGSSKIKAYLKSMGFSESTVARFNEQYAIGGADFLASPLQMAGAASAVISGGKYTKPHTITRIEFISGTNEPIIASFPSTQVLSPGAAWLTSYLMSVNVNNSLKTEPDVQANKRVTPLKRSYTVYGKTGTTSVPDAIAKKYKTASNSAKDTWLLVGTNDYTIASWLGYDYENYSDKTTVMTIKDRNAKQDTTVVKKALDVLEQAFGTPKNTNRRPSSVTSISHIRGLSPYTELPEYADSTYGTSGYILSQYAKVEPYVTQSTMASVENLTVSANTTTQAVSINFSAYPDASKLKAADTTLQLTWGKSTWKGKRVYDSTWIDGTIVYHVVIRDAFGNVLAHLTPTTNSCTWTPSSKYAADTSITVSVYYSYSKVPMQSNTLTRTVTIKGYQPPVPVIPEQETPVDPA